MKFFFILGCALLGVLSAFNTLAQDSKKITIPVFLFLTGDYASLGTSVKSGIELAVSENDLSEQIILKFEDIGTLEAGKMVSAAQKSFAFDNPFCGVTMTADEAAPVAPIFQAKKVPLITLWDSTEDFLSHGNYMFSTGFSAEKAGEKIAEFSIKNLKSKKLAIVSHISAWAEALIKGYKRKAKELGAEVILEQPLSPETTDFRSSLLKVKKLNPDSVFFPLLGNASSFLKQARTYEISSDLVSGDTMIVPGELEASGEAANGVYYGAVYAENEPELRKKTKEEITYMFALSLGYNGMRKILEALALKRSLELSTRDSFEKIIGPSRTLDKEVRMHVVKDGKIAVLEN
ncbi:MAG: ABC transporter substrate-binding protein [Bdellovibrionota bacterium]